MERKKRATPCEDRHLRAENGERRAEVWIRQWKKLASHLLLPTLARIAGLGSALALVVRNSWARHDGEGDDGSVASRRPAIG